MKKIVKWLAGMLVMELTLLGVIGSPVTASGQNG